MKRSASSQLALILAIVVAVSGAARLSTEAGDRDDPDSVAGTLGPTPGPNSQGHIDDKRVYLEGLAVQQPTTNAAGLVSLVKYAPASSAQRMAGSMKVTAVFVKFPGTDPEPQLVRTTLAGAVADRVTDLRHEFEAEIDALESSGATAALAQRKADLAKLRADCICVFAFAVEGVTLKALAALADRPEVRLVDVPDPLTDDLAGWELGPIQPKDPAG